MGERARVGPRRRGGLATGARSSTAVSASELAWRAQRLGELGLHALHRGWCLGPLNETDLRLSSRGPVPRAASGRVAPLVRWNQRLRAARHARAGHDLGCTTLGVPLDTFRRLLAQWGSADAAAFLDDILTEAAEMLALAADVTRAGQGLTADRAPAREILAEVIAARITPAAPPFRAPVGP